VFHFSFSMGQPCSACSKEGSRTKNGIRRNCIGENGTDEMVRTGTDKMVRIKSSINQINPAHTDNIMFSSIPLPL